MLARIKQDFIARLGGTMLTYFGNSLLDVTITRHCFVMIPYLS